MLAVQTHRDQSILVQCVDQGISINVHRCRVEHNLVNGSQFLNKEKHSWPDQNVDLNRPALDNNSHLKITLASGATLLNLLKRKLAVDERFIEVEDKGLTADMLGSLVRDHSVFSWDGALAETASSFKLGELVR